MNTISAMVNKAVIALIICFGFALDARTLITGNDSDSTTETFSTAVGAAAFDLESTFSLTIGAGAATVGNAFAVAQVKRGQNAFIPFAPETLADGSANPLYGAKINHLALFSTPTVTLPVVVKDGEVKLRIYSDVEMKTATVADVSLLASADLQDAAGATTDEIVALAAHRLQNLTSEIPQKDGTDKTLAGPEIPSPAELFFFAAVNDTAGGTFGTGDSGISLAQVVVDVTKIPEADQEIGEDGKPIKTQDTVARVQINNNGAAYAFNGTLSAIKVSNDATLLGDIVDIHVSKRLGRAYIAYSATPGASGARSIVVARIEENDLIFEKIIPNSAVTATNLIVGTSDTTAITAYKVRTMVTSTFLDYLLVAGGNGGVTAVGNKVYAMPLVNNLLDKTAEQKKAVIVSSAQGTLAKYDQTPQIVSGNAEGVFGNEYFKNRKMSIPATSASDLLTNTSQAALVGAGDVPIAATERIADIYTINDSVIVSVNAAYSATSEPGLYESQAIFDQVGRIAGWTPWKRVGGGDDEVFSGMLDQQGRTTNGFGPSFMSVMNDGSGDPKIVRRTDWGMNGGDGLFAGSVGTIGGDGLLAQLGGAFPQNIGGPQGLIDFGFNNGATNKIGLMVATGTGKVVVVQTGQDDGTNVKPFKGDYTVDQRSSSDGSFPLVTDDTRIATVTGPNLTSVGPITSTAIARDTADGSGDNWIVVAGTKGISVLAKADGTSWTGELSTFSTLDTTFSFRTFSNTFPFIKKIFTSENYLWILTTTTLERVSLTSAMVASGELTTTVVASIGEAFAEGTTFADVLVTGPLALLATSRGLFRVGDGANIRTVADSDAALWTQVTYREAIGPVFGFAPLSTTSFASDLGAGGQVYILEAYNGYHQSRGRRLYINIPSYLTGSTTVSSTSVQILDDQQWQIGNVTYLIDFGQMRNSYIPDGGVWFHARSRSPRHDLALFILPPTWRWLNSFATARPGGSTPIAFESSTGTIIRPIIRSAIMGSWLLPGNFGVRVSE